VRISRIRSCTALLFTAALAAALVSATSPAVASTVAAPGATPAVTSDCGGTPTVTAGGTTLGCTFDDEFDGTTLDPAKWDATTTAGSSYRSGTDACFVDSPDNISVGGGVLTLTARQLAQPMTCTDPAAGDYSADYTSGSVRTRDKFSQTYGEFSIRAQFPASTVRGLQSSLWLWPQDVSTYGADSGEIDIAEEYSQYPDRAIPYLHYHPATAPTVISADPNGDNAVGENLPTDDYCYVDDVHAFHTYTAIWTLSYIQILFDGQNCMTDYFTPAAPLIAPAPFNVPFFINLTQALGIGTNKFQPGVTPLPASTVVDWVRVWGAA